MNTRRFWKVCSSGLLMLALLALLAPAPAAGRPALPAPGVTSTAMLCRIVSPNPDEVSVLNAVTTVPALHDSNGPELPRMWAVGYTAARLPVNTARATLILYFNGQSWQVVPSPSPGTENVLTAVAAQSPTDVWAVGYTRSNYTAQPLILHYDGQVWSVWPPPTSVRDARPASVYLNDVQAIGVKGNREAVAVGYIEVMGHTQPLVLHYNGMTWAPMSLPPEMMFGHLYAVTGSSLNNLWAVGTLEFGETPEAYLFHYDPATGWILMAKGQGELTDVAIMGNSLVAIGHVHTPTGSETLAMAYVPKNGDMVRIKTYNKGVDHNVLTALAVGNGQVYAVGYADNPAKGTRETLVLAYTDGAFLPVNAPSPALVNELNGATFTLGRFWTVGSSGQGLQRNTLVMSDQCSDTTVNTR